MILQNRRTIINVALNIFRRIGSGLTSLERALQDQRQLFSAFDCMQQNPVIQLHVGCNLGYQDATDFYKPIFFDACTWNNEGIALFNTGHYAEALRAYDKALELDMKPK